MIENLKKIVDSSDIPNNYKYYWGYMYELGYNYITPFLQKLKVFEKGMSVCEVGSAEAGVLFTFMQAGASSSLATDISENRLEYGRIISKLLNIPIEYVYHNILEDDIPETWQNTFDLVLLRDVIEHLDEPAFAMANIKKLMKPNGKLYVTFPPYYSPYGGHQHSLGGNWLTKLPYLHYLPESLFFKLIKSGRKEDQEEVKSLSNIRLTRKKFEKAVKKAGLKIYRKDFFLFRPVFKSKFNLPTLSINFLSFIPFLQNMLSTEAAYILVKE